MAVLLARFLHFFPGYTAETALQMPWRRFLALLHAIPAVRAEDQLTGLEVAAVAAHPGQKGEQYQSLLKRLRGKMGITAQPVTTVAPGLTPLTSFEAEPGSIEAERDRQKRAHERLLAERERRREAVEYDRLGTRGGGA